MKPFVLVGCLCVLITLVSSCTTTTDMPEAVATQQIEVSSVTVAPSGGAAQPTEPYVFKTSEPDTVTLKGLLLVHNPTGMVPASDDAIFLVPLPQEQANISGIPEFKVGEVPQADVDERVGNFVFNNITPGQYAVMVITENGSQIPATRDDGGVVVVNVTEADLNSTIDLGILNFP